ncbi:MAG TPA: AMIN domain-containing protein [Longimicrobiales bacterium]
MITALALWLAALAAQTSVHGLSVVPVEDRTEVVIRVDGPVAFSDFMLNDPLRLVVDISGATKDLPANRFDAIDRGGVLSLRTSQFRPRVVRVVVDLAAPVEYAVQQTDGAIRISFPNTAGPFEAWHSGAPAPLATAEPAAEPVQFASSAVTPPPPAARSAPPPAARSEPAPAARSEPAPAEEPHINVFFRETPILDVLAHFAEFSGRSIIAGEGVTGNITADIRDQPWDVALRELLAAHGLALEETSTGIIRVDQVTNLREREKVEDLVTRSFKIRYANVDSIRPAVEGLLSERGTVTASAGTNTLVVTDGRSVIEERITPMIQQLDVRTPQVTISAKIIFIDRTALEEFGITYDLKDSQGNQLNQLIPGGVDQNGDGLITNDEVVTESVVRLGGPSIAALANANERVASPSLQLLTTLVLGRHSLFSFIEALDQVSISDLQAQPLITTLDNREATVQVGEETPIRVIDAGSAGAGGGGGANGGLAAPRATVDFRNTGIILHVTPHVTGDQVLLELHAENSSANVAPSDIGVFFTKQLAETQILLGDGETGVIAGLTVTDRSESRTGIPFLMDIPVLGALFRTTTEEENKQDLLIMVTPHIHDAGTE